MSRIKVQQPIIHIPSFKEYKISGAELARKYEALGVKMPFPRSDSWYYHSDDVGWAKILPDLVIKSSLYKPDKFDCDKFARKAFITCCERHGLNTLLYTYGTMPLGPHGFNSFWVGDRFMLLEPNEGFEDGRGNQQDLWGYLDGDLVFEWGENGYQPKAVLI
ncbi:unnamed protein product [marine sediment metagenome]|uniref:Agglutinin C-terminal domain-containing protein n=1 Tax=marine sediment metagenome TaxID=412755 RepID=X1Q5Q4_9ZZZZ